MANVKYILWSQWKTATHLFRVSNKLMIDVSRTEKQNTLAKSVTRKILQG